MNGPELGEQIILDDQQFQRQQHPSQHDEQNSSHTITLPARSSFCAQQIVAIQKLIKNFLKTIMNAAVTIFSMGVGVGLILGDSFQGVSRNSDVSSDSVTNEDGRSEFVHRGTNNESSTGDVSPRSIVGVSRSLLPPQ